MNDELDKCLTHPNVSGIFLGRSVVKDKPVFAVIRDLRGEAIASANGSDSREALTAAIRIVQPRKMPGT